MEKIIKGFSLILMIIVFLCNSLALGIPSVDCTLRAPLACSADEHENSPGLESRIKNKEKLWSLIEKSSVLDFVDKATSRRKIGPISIKSPINLDLFNDKGDVIELESKDLKTKMVYHKLLPGLVPFISHFGFFQETGQQTLTSTIMGVVKAVARGNIVLAFRIPNEKVRRPHEQKLIPSGEQELVLSGHSYKALHENFLPTLEFYFGDYSSLYEERVELLKTRKKHFASWGRLEPVLIDWEESLRATLIINLWNANKDGLSIEQVTTFSEQCEEYLNELRNFPILEQFTVDRDKATEASL